MTREERITWQCRAVLLMVLELHLQGYQRLRILPAMAPSGGYWQCSIAPVTFVSTEHGARLDVDYWDSDLVASYSSSDQAQYFGWRDVSPHTTPRGLARRFIQRFPQTSDLGRGSDWAYSGWYVEMLHMTHPNRFPVALKEYGPDDYITTAWVGHARGKVRIPLPPPGAAPPRDAPPRVQRQSVMAADPASAFLRRTLGSGRPVPRLVRKS